MKKCKLTATEHDRGRSSHIPIHRGLEPERVVNPFRQRQWLPREEGSRATSRHLKRGGINEGEFRNGEVFRDTAPLIVEMGRFHIESRELGSLIQSREGSCHTKP